MRGLPTGTVHHLDLSRNRFDVESTHALAAWLAALGDESSPLEKLILNDCTLNVSALFDPKNAGAIGALARLEVLDLAANTSMQSLNGKAALQFTLLVAQLTRMRRLNLTDTSADACAVIVPTISLLLSNANVSCALEVGGTNFGAAGAALALQKGLSTARATSLRVLDISRCNVTPADLRLVLLGLSGLDELDTLRVSRALASPATLSESDGKLIADTLASLCAQKATLRSLCVAGLGAKVVLPLLQRLVRNTTLWELDVSCNTLLDAGATVLALFLRMNTSLRALRFDENGFALPSFLALCAAIVSSQQSQLRHLEFPWRDYERVGADVREQAREALLQLHDTVTLRRGSPVLVSAPPLALLPWF